MNYYAELELSEQLVKFGFDTQEKYTASQMLEILLGLNKNVDVTIYANPKYTPKKMQEIRDEKYPDIDFIEDVIEIDNSYLFETCQYGSYVYYELTYVNYYLFHQIVDDIPIERVWVQDYLKMLFDTERLSPLEFINVALKEEFITIKQIFDYFNIKYNDNDITKIDEKGIEYLAKNKDINSSQFIEFCYYQDDYAINKILNSDFKKDLFDWGIIEECYLMPYVQSLDEDTLKRGIEFYDPYDIYEEYEDEMEL